MGVSSLQCHTALVSGFCSLANVNYETYSHTEFANVDVYGNILKSVIEPRIGALRKGGLVADLSRTGCEG